MSQHTPKILLFLILFCLPNFVFGQQQTPQKEWSIRAGIHKVVFKDLNYAPFQYQGNGTTIAVGNQRNTKRRDILQFQAAFASATIKSEFSRFTETPNVNIQLQLGYLFRLSNQGSKLQYHLGGSLRSNINYNNYDEFEAVTYFNLHTVNIAASINYQLSAKSMLRGQLTLPLFGISVRPPLTGWDHTINTTAPLTLLYKGDLAIIGNFIALASQLTYSYQLSQKMNIQVHALSHYQHTKKTNAFSSAAVQLAIGLNFKF